MSQSSDPQHDGVFKALADPTRRRILRLLRESELSAGEIAAQFDMSAPSVSHHLAALTSAKLIRVRREGPKLIYSLDATVMQELLAAMLELFGREGDARS